MVTHGKEGDGVGERAEGGAQVGHWPPALSPVSSLARTLITKEHRWSS
jgi:hypothetical protein